MLVAVVALLALGTPTQASASIASQHALLTPQVRRGEILTWFGAVDTWSSFGPESRSILLACSVTSQDRNRFTLSRRLRVILPHRAPSATMERPAIVIGEGHEYKLDGTPLNDEPVCLIYSPTMYGSPPQTLKVGTKWRFTRPLNFGYGAGLHGTATVTRLDPHTDSVSLHIAEPGLGSVVDMTVFDGGIIETESDQSESHRNPYLPQSASGSGGSLSWTLQRRSLVGLWNYPAQPTPDLFDPNGHFISVERFSFQGTPIAFVRVWHFGPYIFKAADFIPPLPQVRDVILVLGTIALVLLVGRAAMLSFSAAGQPALSPAARKRRLYVTGALALIAAASSMWWVYH
jgi:hypothetical protein